MCVVVAAAATAPMLHCVYFNSQLKYGPKSKAQHIWFVCYTSAKELLHQQCDTHKQRAQMEKSADNNNINISADISVVISSSEKYNKKNTRSTIRVNAFSPNGREPIDVNASLCLSPILFLLFWCLYFVMKEVECDRFNDVFVLDIFIKPVLLVFCEHGLSTYCCLANVHHCASIWSIFKPMIWLQWMSWAHKSIWNMCVHW